MFQPRPPSATSPTAESQLSDWASGQSQTSHHNYSGSTSHPPPGGLSYLFANDRRGPGGAPGLGPGPGPVPGPSPGQGQSGPGGGGGYGYGGTSQGLHGGGGGRGETSSTSPYIPSSSPYPPSNQLSSSRQGGRGGQNDGSVGGGGGGGTPQPSGQSELLLNNLSQHLNNPPAPSGPYSNFLSPNPPPGGLGSSANSGLGGGGGIGVGAGGILNMSLGTSSGVSGLGGPNGSGGAGGGAGGGTPGQGKLLLLPNGAAPPAGSEEEKIYQLITELLDPETRETALLELSKKREMYEDLALVLWGGFGIMSSLLLEIVNVYPALHPPSLTAHASNRVCNALALLQCVASHAETRSLFLNAHIPLFLYPFLNTTSKTRPFEYLRLTSLGVIGALVKQNENSDVINFLLSTEIIPLCLRIMETGSELSKTVAIFIVQKILLDDLGLQYICQTYERFYAVGAVLANMVQALVESQAVRLLKHVVRCYLRMSDNPRAREALRACLPDALKDNTFAGLLKGDMVTRRCLSTLLHNLNERPQE